MDFYQLKRFFSLFVVAFVIFIFIVLIYTTFVISRYAQKQQKINDSYAKEKITPKITNPASVFCIEQGGIIKIQTAFDGSQSGLCILKDGRSCDEWEFFRTKECK